MMTDAPTKRPHDIVDVPELEPLRLEDRPDGPGVAAMLAAGIGILVLGLFTVLAEVSEGLKDWLESLEFGRGVGPLAGKTLMGSLAFVVSWIVLGLVLKDKEVDMRRWFWVAFALGVLGAIMMFPPVFEAFASE
jgi:hypothetical protein